MKHFMLMFAISDKGDIMVEVDHSDLTCADKVCVKLRLTLRRLTVYIWRLSAKSKRTLNYTPRHKSSII